MASDRHIPPQAEGRRAILVEIGSGELIDRITILQIKAERMGDPAKRANVRLELELLERARREYMPADTELERLEAELKAVNLRLWTVEDDIRACEAAGDFGPTFISLARTVYQTNDRRAALKKSINLATGARVIEEKSYGDRNEGAPSTA